MFLLSQQPTFSNDPETKDFDLSAGDRWIYPENYPIRNYQYSIVETALFHNTLICLPTGLGKTFIAAVVMYNFWRWYPHGIIIFLAPTKPLVTQQIDACHNIMGIPISDTIELTGKINPQQRELIWRKKRVIFATPQTFQKDLETKIVPSKLIKCVVIDEAHKATGKHSYSESIKELNKTNPYFRIIGLSATPGSKLEAVQQVIQNLKITHLELRDDTSSDIKPYINERKTDIILVGLGNDLINFKEKYIQIMDRHVKVLLNNNVIRSAASNISKGQMFLLMQQCQANKNKYRNYGTVMKALTILTTMAHAYEVITRHGLRSFYNFYKSHMNDSKKSWLREEIQLSELIDEIGEYIGPFPNVGALIDGTETEIPDNIIFGHGKFDKLKELLLIHFTNANNNKINTRAMVFVETRDIANEIYVLLLSMRPIVRPQIFVGQAGLKQKAQSKAVDDFRNDIVNVLVSTSVGEEGLDFGEVDLIICFEISQVNPTRLVQRMGRTGRKRDGHIIVLVTDGKEHQTLKASINKRDGLNQKVLTSNVVISSLLPSSPRMVPDNIHPKCLKMNITIIPKLPASKITKTKKTKAVNTKKGIETTKRCEYGTMKKFLTTNTYNLNDNDDDDSTIVPMKKIESKNEITKNQFIKNNGGIIKPCHVKLLTSDTHGNDFLTLCAIKNSENELKNNVIHEISYLPKLKSFNDDDDLFNDNFELSNDEIIKCLATLGECIKNEDITMTPAALDIDVNTNIQTRKSSESHDEIMLSNEFKIDDLFNDSDSDTTYYESGGGSPPKECVDWSANNSNDNAVKNFDENISIDSINYSPTEPEVEAGFQNILDDSTDDEEVQETPDYLRQFDKMALDTNSKKSINNNDSKNISKQPSPALSFEDYHAKDDEDVDIEIEKGFLSILDQSSSDSLDDFNENKNNSSNKKQNDIESKMVHLDDNKIINSHNSSINNINNLAISETELMDTDIFFNDDDDEIVESSPSKISKSQLLKDKTFKNDEKSNILDGNLADIDTLVLNTDSMSYNDKHFVAKPPLNIFKSQTLNNKRNFSDLDTLVINNNDDDDDDDDEVVEKTPPKPKQKSLSQRINYSRRITNQSSFSKSQSNTSVNLQQNSSNFPSFDFSGFKINKKKPSIERKQYIAVADTVVLETAELVTQNIPSNNQRNDENNFVDNNSQETKFYTPPETLPDTVKVVNDNDDDDDFDISSSNCHGGILDNKINSADSFEADDIADTAVIDTSHVNPVNNKSTKSIDPVQMLDDEETYFPPWEYDSGQELKSQKNKTDESNKKENIAEADTVLIDTMVITTQCQTQNDRKENKSTSIINGPSQDVVNKKNIDTLPDTVLIPEDEEINFSTWETSTPEKSKNSNTFSFNHQKEIEKNSRVISRQASFGQIEMIDGLFDSDFEIDDNKIINEPEKQQEKLASPKKYEFNPDDYDWGSDFDTSLDPLIESKHFKTTKLTNESSNAKKNTSSFDNRFACLSKTKKPIDLNSYSYKENKPSINKLQTINKKPSSKGQVIFDDNSDDDFAPSKIQKRVFSNNQSNFINIRNNKSPIPGTSKNININDDDDDDDSKKIVKNNKEIKRKKLTKKKNKIRSNFIDDEAEVSTGPEDVSSGDEEEEDENGDLDGFVSYSQQVDDGTDMRAHYLQSIKSPKGARGRFIIRQPKSPAPDVQIYSQAIQEPDNYQYDSFCVRESDIEYSDGSIENYNKISRKKKRKRDESSGPQSKRKRIVSVVSDNSSDDEIEKMRFAIVEESKRLNHS
ncbi:Fanconi anemia group M protein [Aphidius gifuensis]|uniref:Fanconi anemia group M protein n=1 Tax=Aphidius gifuensis TaxID=684658 RepID=UPI001CDC8E0C|nr:Fanconi anemia group M protein [Aphidius gifuensis]